MSLTVGDKHDALDNFSFRSIDSSPTPSLLGGHIETPNYLRLSRRKRRALYVEHACRANRDCCRRAGRLLQV